MRMGSVEEAGRAVEALGKPHPGGGAMVVRYADSPEEKLRYALSVTSHQAHSVRLIRACLFWSCSCERALPEKVCTLCQVAAIAR